MSLTDIFLEQFKAAQGTDTARLQEAAKITVAIEPGGGWVDSHRVGEVLIQERVDRGLDPDPVNTVSYGQHLFRHTKHVCHYADEGCYRLHLPEKCSPSCDKYRRGTHRPNEARTICPSCFLMVSCTGSCGCED